MNILSEESSAYAFSPVLFIIFCIYASFREPSDLPVSPLYFAYHFIFDSLDKRGKQVYIACIIMQEEGIFHEQS